MATSDFTPMISAPGGSKLLIRWVYNQPDRDGWQRMVVIGGGGSFPFEASDVIQQQVVNQGDNVTNVTYAAPTIPGLDLAGIEFFQPEQVQGLEYIDVGGLGGLLGTNPAGPAGPAGEVGAPGVQGRAGGGGGGGGGGTVVSYAAASYVQDTGTSGDNRKASAVDHRHILPLADPCGLEWYDPGGGAALQLRVKVGDRLGFDSTSKVLTTCGASDTGIDILDAFGGNHHFVLASGLVSGYVYTPP